MKRVFIGSTLGCLLWASTVIAMAQSAPDLPSAQEREQTHSQLRQRRQAMQEANKQDVRQCYQEFDVTDCLNRAREKRIAAHTVLRKEELRLSEIERQVKAQETKARLDERNSPEKQAEAQAQRDQAQQDSQARAQSNAQKNADATRLGTGRAAYDKKQQQAQEHRAELQQRLKDNEKSPAAPLPLPPGAK